MYISQAQLRELGDFYTENAAITLYVYSSPQESRDRFHKRLNRLLQSVEDKVSAFEGPVAQWMTKGQYLDQLKEALLDVFLENKGQTCCVFITDEQTVVVDLPVRFGEFTVVDHRFFTAPLTGLLAQFERFAVLVCDPDHARLYGVYLNEIEEQKNIFVESIPPTVNTEMPAWECLHSVIVNQRLLDPVQRHFKTVTDRLVQHFAELGFDGLFIGAPESLQVSLRNHLPHTLQDRLISSFSADTGDSLTAIQKRIHPFLREHRRRREVDTLVDLQQTRNSKLVALGIHVVTQAIMAGQVRRLVISDDCNDEGWICPQGHLVAGSFSKENTCSWCHADLEPIQSLAEALLVEALSQHTDVYNILHAKEAWEGHSVGAFLRFPVQPLAKTGV